VRSAASAAGVALILAGAAYAAWILSGVLNPGVDAQDGYVSDLSAADQPHNGFFAGADIVAGLLVLVAVGLILAGRVARVASPDTAHVVSGTGRGLSRLGRSRRVLAGARLVGWLGLGLFGAPTVADASTPMDCPPYRDTTCALLERANHLSVTHQAHAVTSSLAVSGAIISMVALTIAVPPLRVTGVVLTAVEIAFGLGSLAAMFGGRWLGILQRGQVATVSVWLVVLGILVLRARPTARADRSHRYPRELPGQMVTVGATPLHVVSDGSGSPAVVLVAGLGGAWFDWDPLVPMLARGHRTIRFDRPGLGASPPADGTVTLHGEADRLAALVAALDLHRPIVVAHSVGALHAEAYARRHPGSLAGLVLIDPSCEPDVRPRGPVQRRLADALRRAAPALGRLAAVTGLARLLGPQLRTATIRRVARCDAAPGDPADVRAVYGTGRVVTASLIEVIAYRDLATDLLQLRTRQPFPPIPTVVLTARDEHDHDWETRHAELADLLSGRHIVVSDVGHLLHIDRPDVVAAAVESLSEALR
jgi:pimeloyl-ACP methyl ester carboxylesterase